jgi:hypothetical protein
MPEFRPVQVHYSLQSPCAHCLSLENIKPRAPIVRRLPKACRRLATAQFTSLLEMVVADNSPSTWEKLLSFASRCLFSPRRGGKNNNKEDLHQ